MGPWGLVPLEGAPEFSVAAFDSRPLFPSAAYRGCHEGWEAIEGCVWTPTWSDIWLTNHIAQAVIGALLVLGFWLFVKPRRSASTDPKANGVIPSKRQFVGEWLYNLIRNGVARDIIGHDYQKYVPYLVALFTFILVNNLFGQTFLFMFPTFSKIGFAWGLAACSWILYNAVGIKKKGLVGYLRAATLPQGVPLGLAPLVIPLEFLSNIIVRPLTLGLRLFANLFAGHLVVMVFVVGGSWLLLSTKESSLAHSPVWNVAGGLALLLSFFVFAIELLVACLQAYIFTVLTAQYVSSSLAEEH
ncbi:MAG: F0F1 ATP synthase subunit A [Propionibacteriaceae bacterium]|jgi:F-type H+-transporting ATPase subunit a|nr:F0F1 ATP synthase subunit A [Propionibacteriaceae bacterium]